VIRGSLRQPADPYPRSIGSAVFVGLTMMTKRQTDRQTDRATIFHKSSELGYLDGTCIPWDDMQFTLSISAENN